jgi:hypothetical protein
VQKLGLSRLGEADAIHEPVISRALANTSSAGISFASPRS